MGEYQCLKKCEVPWKDEEQEDGRKEGEYLERKGDGGKKREGNREMIEEKDEMEEEGKNKNGRDKEREEVEFDIRKLKDGGEIELNMKARKKNGKKWKSPRNKCGNYKSSCDSNSSNPAQTSSYHSPSPNLPPFSNPQNFFPCSNSNTSSISPSSIPLPLPLHPPYSTIPPSSFLPHNFNITSTCSLHPLSSFAPPISEIVPPSYSPPSSSTKTWILEGLDSGEETLCISLQKEGSEEKFKRNYEGLAPFLGDFHMYMAGEGVVEVEGIDMELRKRRNKRDEEDDEIVSKCRCEII